MSELAEDERHRRIHREEEHDWRDKQLRAQIAELVEDGPRRKKRRDEEQDCRDKRSRAQMAELTREENRGRKRDYEEQTENIEERHKWEREEADYETKRKLEHAERTTRYRCEVVEEPRKASKRDSD